MEALNYLSPELKVLELRTSSFCFTSDPKAAPAVIDDLEQGDEILWTL